MGDTAGKKENQSVINYKIQGSWNLFQFGHIKHHPGGN